MWPDLQQVLLLRLQTQYLVDTPHTAPLSLLTSRLPKRISV